MNELLKEAFYLIYGATTDLAIPALVFLLISIFLNRKKLADVLIKLLPKGWLINYLIFLTDFLLITPLATVLFIWLLKINIPNHWFPYLNDLPDFLILGISLLLGDFIGYLRHRLEHTQVLWSMHLLHHSDRHMSWLTLFRIHPLNRLITTLIDNSFLLLCGMPLWAVVANSIIRHYYGMLIHANLPWTYGWLGKIFVSPAMHRWHHVLEGKGTHSNFATIFSIIDRLFGTYYVPGPCNALLGVKSHDSTSLTSFIKQLWLPIGEFGKAFASITGKLLSLLTRTTHPPF